MKNLAVIVVVVVFYLSNISTLQAQFKLKLLDIKCIVTEDSGEDEVYIKIDGRKYWGVVDMNNQDVKSLVSVRPYAFNCPIIFEIYDEDGISSSDLLGKFTISVATNSFSKLGRTLTKEFGSLKQTPFYRIHYQIILDD